MGTIFYSAKGGNCTTVTAAAHAAIRASRGEAICLVDLCGDAPAVLGLAEPDGPGVLDWLAESSHEGVGDLLARAARVTETLSLVHRGTQFVSGRPRWGELLALVSAHPGIVIDAGTGFIPDEVHAAADRSVLVTRPCYLSLRRAVHVRRATDVAVIDEPDRALGITDVAHVLGVRSPIRVPHSAAIGRAVDAGLLLERAPRLFADMVDMTEPANRETTR